VEGAAALWDFLEFVVTVRTSIYPMFRPFISHKVRKNSNSSQNYSSEFKRLRALQMAKAPTNDNERHFQFVIREKMRGVTLGKCKGTLLIEIAHQLKQLKEELETKQGKSDDIVCQHAGKFFRWGVNLVF